jgi:phenylalanine-4-hydroxylase
VSATPKDFTDCTATLSKIAKITTILDNDPDTSNPTWFPRRIRELDIFASRVLGACEDLESDHPGFHDQAYRERRNYFAAIANKYKHGEPLPRVEYSPSEIETWSACCTLCIGLTLVGASSSASSASCTRPTHARSTTVCFRS